MHKLTKLLPLGLAAGLLLTACEIPGGPPPAGPTIVIADPGDGITDFSGFPAIFKGTNIVLPQPDEVNTQTILADNDEFQTELDGPVTIQVHCDVGNPDLWVYVEAQGQEVINAPCGPGQEILAPETIDGYVYIEIHSVENDTPGVYPYVVKVDVVESQQEG